MAKKILVVDDDAPVLTLIVENLQSLGYKIVQASEGYQALQLAQSELPDLIVLDIRMPAGGGLNAYDNIRRRSQLSSTPIIFSTAYVTGAVLKIVEQDPRADYIAKPFRITELIAKIKKQLGEE